MSANIQSMAYVKADGKPWHGLGVAVDGAMTAEEALVKAGLNWTVEKKPLYHEVMTKEGMKFEPVTGSFCITRTDNNKVLGRAVGSVYTPLQNRNGLNFLDGVIKEKMAVYHTAGSLGQGERVWILAKLPGHIKVAGNDLIEKFLLLTNSHDGSSPVIMQVTPVRVVCQNTLNAALSGSEKQFRGKHTISLMGKMDEARHQLQIVNTWYEQFEASCQQLVSVKVNGQQVSKFLDNLGFEITQNVKADDDSQSRVKGIRETITHLFESGRGNRTPEVRGTAWALYNGVTEWTDHERSTKITNGYQTKDEARLASQWFGSGQQMKTKALELALAIN